MAEHADGSLVDGMDMSWHTIEGRVEALTVPAGGFQQVIERINDKADEMVVLDAEDESFRDIIVTYNGLAFASKNELLVRWRVFDNDERDGEPVEDVDVMLLATSEVERTRRCIESLGVQVVDNPRQINDLVDMELPPYAYRLAMKAAVQQSNGGRESWVYGSPDGTHNGEPHPKL